MKISYQITLTICLVSALFTCQPVNSDQEGEEYIYRDRMVSFVSDLSKKAKSQNEDFYVIAQNAEVLLSHNGLPDGKINTDYLNAIDGISKEGLFYGYLNDDEATTESVRNNTISYLDRYNNNGKKVMAVDYCSSQNKIENSYQLARGKGYISFAAQKRELNTVPDYKPELIQENSSDINQLSEARNFVYVLNPNMFNSKRDFLSTLHKTNYDMIVLDWVYFRGLPITKAEVNELKKKANGRNRLVIAYMSIGEAEDYRYYWQEEWNQERPDWIENENPNWPGNYPVQYWNDTWKDIIYRNEDSYLSKLLEAGYDGVYLDRVDAYYHFEQK